MHEQCSTSAILLARVRLCSDIGRATSIFALSANGPTPQIESMTEASGQTHKFECACKKVKVQVSGAPVFQGLCHCVNCRDWYQLSPVSFAVFPANSVKVTEGSDNITEVSLVDPKLERLFCKNCGFRINTQHVEHGVQIVNVFNMENFEFKPVGHNFCKDAKPGSLERFKGDSLPKWLGAPPAFGGPDDRVKE